MKKLKSHTWAIIIALLIPVITIPVLVKYQYFTPPTHIQITGLRVALSDSIETSPQVTGEAEIYKNIVKILVLNAEQDTIICDSIILTGVPKTYKTEAFKVVETRAMTQNNLEKYKEYEAKLKESREKCKEFEAELKENREKYTPEEYEAKLKECREKYKEFDNMLRSRWYSLLIDFKYGLSKKQKQAFFHFRNYELTGEIK